MAIRYTSSFDAIPFSDTDAQFHLTANTAETVTIPGDATMKFILTFGYSTSLNLFVGYNVSAVVPAANTVTTTSGIEFIVPGEQRYAIGGDVLSLITPDANLYGGISIRSIPS